MKRIIALVCSFALILGVFCACAKADPESTTKAPASTQSTTSGSGLATDSSETSAVTEKDSSSTESTPKSTVQPSTRGTTEKSERASFPTFDTEDIFGAKVSSKVFKEKKLTVVNVFTTWCAPCKQELPELAALDKELEDIGFIGIVIDINEGDGVNESALRTAKDLCNDSNASYPYLITDDSLTAFCRDIYTVPTTYFVDKDGKIVGDPIVGANSASDWKEIIEQKLAML